MYLQEQNWKARMIILFLFSSNFGLLWMAPLCTTIIQSPSLLHYETTDGSGKCLGLSLKRSWMWKAAGLLLSGDKFQVANSRHACAPGSVTTDLQPLPPSRPAQATPLIVSDSGNWFQLTPIQQAFDWQTKDTATWRLMLGLSSLEVVQAPPASSFLSHGSYHASAWSCSAPLLIKTRNHKGYLLNI